MPNYCYNSITIRGEKKHIDHIKKSVIVMTTIHILMILAMIY